MMQSRALRGGSLILLVCCRIMRIHDEELYSVVLHPGREQDCPWKRTCPMSAATPSSVYGHLHIGKPWPLPKREAI